MTNKSNSVSKKPKHTDPANHQDPRKITHPGDLTTDPDYLNMLDHFQVAEFTQCQQLLSNLEVRYPGHPVLSKFREELKMKLSVKGLRASIKKEEKRYKRKSTLNLGLVAVISVIVILIAFYFSLNYFVGQNAADPQETPVVVDPNLQQLTQLYSQAEGLLQVGRPGPAAEIIEQIGAIDPDFPNLDVLTERTEELLRLEAQYQSALDLSAQGQYTQALEIFQTIEAERPGLWNVSQQIRAVETQLQVNQLLEQGQAAYLAEDWAEVISAYENVMRLDANINDSTIKEQLLRSYLNQIILMLDNENTAIEDIEQAEGYYRKATALFPQSREFASERGNLQEVTSDLLEIKLIQIAKANLADPRQTLGSVAQAVSYTRKAANLKPRNTALQQDLQNAESYQIGLQNFVNLNWTGVITTLEPLIASDPNYAGGNAGVLLYEAYIAVAKQYYNAEIYPDALKHLEQAEFIAWRNLDNLAQLFQIQTMLGNTLGKMGEYEDAVSYYRYALDAIQAATKVQNNPNISSRLAAAQVSNVYEEYEQAYLTFQEVLGGIDEEIYTLIEIEISDGAIVALFAHENLSTLDNVLNANNLPTEMVIRFVRPLQVPLIENLQNS